MECVCIEEKTIDKHTRQGLRILARIIARDLLANQVANGDIKNIGPNDKHKSLILIGDDKFTADEVIDK